MPEGLYPWLMAGMWANVALMVAAGVLALWLPVVGLVVAGLAGSTVAIAVSAKAPPAYRYWSL
jgi:hypothetical protein